MAVVQITLEAGKEPAVEVDNLLLELAAEVHRLVPVKARISVYSPYDTVLVEFFGLMIYALVLAESLSPMKVGTQKFGMGGTCDVVLPYRYNDLRQAISILQKIDTLSFDINEYRRRRF